MLRRAVKNRYFTNGYACSQNGRHLTTNSFNTCRRQTVLVTSSCVKANPFIINTKSHTLHNRVLLSSIARNEAPRDTGDFVLMSRSELDSINPTKKEEQLEELAKKLLSLRDPKVRSLFLQSNNPEQIDTLMMNVKRVVNFFSDPETVLPLQTSGISIGNKNGSGNHGNGNYKRLNRNSYRRPGQMFLSGPELCHSIMTTAVLPNFAQKDNITSKNVKAMLNLSLQTVQSLGKLSAISNPRSATNLNGHDKNRKYLQRQGGTTSLGDLAEELLRLVINTPLSDSSIEGNSSSYLERLYNNTLHTWSIIASSEPDPIVAKNAALRSEKLLLDLAMSKKNKPGNWDDEQHSTLLSSGIRPNIVSFNTCITSWGKSGRYEYENRRVKDVTTKAAAQRAEAILHLLQDLQGEAEEFELGGNMLLLANEMSYDAVIQAWSRAKDPDAPNQAMRVLENMMQRYYEDHSSKNTSIADLANRPLTPFPSRRTFCAVLTTFARSSHPDAITKSENIMTHMKELVESGYEQVRPNDFVFNALLAVYAAQVDHILFRCRNRSIQQHDKAKMLHNAYKMCARMDEILTEMIEVSSQNANKEADMKTDPNFTTYKTILLPLIGVGKELVNLEGKRRAPFTVKEIASQAETHFRNLEMTLRQDPKSEQARKLPIQVCGDMIKMYSASGGNEKAKELFLFFANSRSCSAELDLISEDFDDLLDSLLRTRTKFSPPGKVLNEIDAFCESHANHGIYSSIRRINGFIEAHGKRAKHNLRHVRRADQIMTQALKNYNESIQAIIAAKANNTNLQMTAPTPNIFTLHYVLSAYAGLSGSPKLSLAERGQVILRIEEILSEMEMMQQLRLSESDRQIANWLAAIVPNVQPYNQTLKAYSSLAKYTSTDADIEIIFGKAERLMRRMHDYGIANDYSYSSMFNILSHMKPSKAQDRTMDILNDALNSIDVDIAVFNSALSVITKAKNKKANAVAFEILAKLEDGTYPVKPDKYTFSTLMASLAHQGTVDAAQKVEVLYQRMMDRYETEISKNPKFTPTIKPDTFNYNSIISAWANIGTKESCRNAENYLDRLIIDDGSMGPDIASFSGLINGCSQRNDEEAAADCERILNKLEDYCKHTPIRWQFSNYIQTMTAYSKANNPEGCLRVLQSLVRKMDSENFQIESTRDANQLKQVYEYVISSYKALERNGDALPKLQHIFEIQEADGRIKPSHFMYCSLMDSHAMRRHPDSLKEVNKILERIIEENKTERYAAFPSIAIYNLLFKACELCPTCSDNSNTNDNPAIIAFDRFTQSQASAMNINPTMQTYVHLLAICTNHVQEDAQREKMARFLFQKCCSDGMLSDAILSTFKSAMSDNNFEKFVSDFIRPKQLGKRITIKDFPHKHKRNAEKTKKHRGARQY